MSPATRRARYTLIMALLLFAGLAGALLYASSKAARLVSGALTDALGQPVSVSLVGFSPASGLTLYGLTIKNPAGFKSPYLLGVKSLNIMPDYAELAHGRLVFGSLGVFSPTVYLEKDGSGQWNFQPMADKLAKGKPRKFTLSKTRIRGGSLSLAGQGVTLSLPELTLGRLSTIEPAPTPFSLRVMDEKGSSVTCEGEAGILTKTKEIRARMAFKGGNLESYIAPPKGVDLHGSSLQAALDFSYKEGLAAARLGGRLSSVRSAYFKEKSSLVAEFRADVRYRVDTGALEIRSAGLDIPGVGDVTASGAVTDMLKDPAVALTVKPSAVELARLGPYLPSGMKAEGVIRPGPVSIKGKLKPLSVSAAAGVKVSGAGLYYKGAYLKGASGSARASVTPAGAVEADVSLTASGGSLAGTATYASGAGAFSLRCRGLDLARVGLAGLGPVGTVDAEASGNFGRPSGSLRAAFKVSGTGIGVRSAGVSAGNVVLSGEAAGTAVNPGISGVLSGKDAIIKGRTIGSVTTGFTWSPGTLTLTRISLIAKDFNASADSLSLAYSGQSVKALLTGINASYGKDAGMKDAQLSAAATLPEGAHSLRADGSFKVPSGEAFGVSLAGLSGSFRYADGAADLDVAGQAVGSPVTLSAGASFSGAGGLKNPYLSGKLNVTRAESLAPLIAKRGSSLSFAKGTLSAEFSLKGDDLDKLSGSASVKAAGFGLDMGGRPLVRDLAFELRPSYDKGALRMPESELSFGGSFKASVSGHAARDGNGWSGSLTARLPETPLPSLQEGLLNALPPTLKWADTAGSASLDVGLDAGSHASDGAGVTGRLTGSLTLKGATLSIPDQQVTVGPADGTVPIAYSFGGKGKKAAPAPYRQEPFEREEFDRLIKKYSAMPGGVNLTIKKAAFGLFEADDIEMSLVPGDGWYQVDWLGLRGFGANVYGYALADFTGARARYALSLLVSGFSLTELCAKVPGINGYLSGKVSGMARLFASGTGYSGVAGAAAFWTYEAPGEDMAISKEFLKRLMGKSMRTYMLMGDRSFDTGELDAIFSGGYIVFDRLLISHTNFLGKQDLKVSVAPVSNKVAIEHLIEVMKDVSERAGAIK